MRTISGMVRGAKRLALAPELSDLARKRLKWLDYYREHKDARLTCRHFDIPPQTFYRWKRRYDSKHLESLENRSRRPKHVRQPTWSGELVQAVLRLREQYPRWGKDKLAVLLRRQDWQVSVSMVGRILRYLKERGVLREPRANGVSVRQHRYPRPYGVRKPRDYVVKHPGDLVEVDTLDVRPVPGLVLKHFTARDVVSRWDVLEVHRTATANTAAHFLDTLEERLPFRPRALQVDGGSEFQAQFEVECQRRGILLFVLPPRSPKLNGHVERAHRTHTEEFYEVEDFPLDIADLNRALLVWEQTYNTIRPHQALGYLTPEEYVLQCRKERSMCH
jgi:putative transposase